MSPVRGICFVVFREERKVFFFSALWIFVEIRTMFVFLFMAAFTFRMSQVFLKVILHFKCSNMRDCEKQGEGYPVP